MASALAIKFIYALISFLACLSPAVTKTGPTHGKVVVCYIQTWAVYRPGDGSYSIEHFDPNLCTHAVYAFAGLDAEKHAIKSLDPWQDLKDGGGKNGFERLVSLKKTNPHLKVTLAIGGWNEKSENYSMMAADPWARQQFVRQVSEYVRRYNFDGLDLDWEYPTQRGGKPADKENFVSLVRELRQEFNKYNLLLTSAIAASSIIISEAYDVRALSNLLDYLHVMCYDYSGSWDAKVGPNAPLRYEGILSVEYTIQFLLNAGAPPSKIVMGMPLYGRTFLTTAEGKYGDPSDSVGFQGPYTRENGFLGYNEICALLSDKKSGWTSTWDPSTAQSIAKYHDIEQNRTKVVTYDSTRSVVNKMRFIVEKNLIGAMVWAMDTDDFRGNCAPDTDTYVDFENLPKTNVAIPKRVNSNYPLLRTINEALVIYIEQAKQVKEREQENIIDVDENKSKNNDNTSGSSATIHQYIINGIFIQFIVYLTMLTIYY